MIEDKFNKIELSSELLEELISKFINDSKEKNSTKNAKEYGLLYFLNYHKSQTNFFFTPDDFNVYFSFLTGKSKLSKHTVRNYISSLNLFCEYLAKCGVIDKNPVKRIKKVIKQDEVVLKYFTKAMLDDICVFLSQYLSTDYSYNRNNLIPLFMIHHFLDEEEITNVKVSDIHKIQDDYYICVRGQKQKIDSKISLMVASLLGSRYKLKTETYLFVTDSKKSSGHKLSVRNVREIVKNFVIKNGFDGMPYRVIYASAVLYNYDLYRDDEMFLSVFNIKSKSIVDRFKNEYVNFIGEN